MSEHRYFVYILTNRWNRVLYVGITNDLVRRIHEHREKRLKGFTRKYNVTRLVYFEQFTDPVSAIQREKQIKNGSRKNKVRLIEETNPRWKDLFPEIASPEYSSR